MNDELRSIGSVNTFQAGTSYNGCHSEESSTKNLNTLLYIEIAFGELKVFRYAQNDRPNFLLSSILYLLSSIFFTASPLTAQTIYAVVLGNQKYVVGSSTLHSGLFRSNDLGRTWEHLGPENLKAFSMDAVDSSKGRILYIAAGNGVHRSLDSGKTWKIVTDWRMTEVLDVKVDQRDPQWVYAATAWGLWSSSDGGETWDTAHAMVYQKMIKHGYVHHLDIAYEPGSVFPTYTLALIQPHTSTSTRPEIFLGVHHDSIWMLPDWEHERIIRDRPLGDLDYYASFRKYRLLQQITDAFKDVFTYEDLNSHRDTAPSGPSMNLYDVVYDRRQAQIAYVVGDSGIWRYKGAADGVWSDITANLPTRVIHALALVHDTLLAGTFGEGIYRREGDHWIPSGLEGSQVWRLVVKEY